MYDDDPTVSLLYRKKTCPCCRTIVRSRPIPLFLVKSLTASLEKAKAPPGTRRVTPPPDDDDPWAGIFIHPFLHDAEDAWAAYDDGDDEDGDEDEDYDEDEDDWSVDGYGTADDEERYEGPYVHPRWQPPSVNVFPEDYAFIDELDASDLSMLRRGATLQMIDLFSMNYTHDEGLSAVVDGENTVYLGWNIYVHPEDESGEDFMDWITTDMYQRPERWDVTEAMDGTWTAYKLVPEEDDDGEDYETSDSEFWAAELANEEF